MSDPRCASCQKVLTEAVAWLGHRGGPLCERCVDYRVGAGLVRLRERGGPRCQACGRFVLDLRKRGQVVLACSFECRREILNDLRRMERRAMRPTLPPIRCVECDADLHVTRSDIRYCSTLCRVRAHRRRTKERSAAGRVPT